MVNAFDTLGLAMHGSKSEPDFVKTKETITCNFTLAFTPLCTNYSDKSLQLSQYSNTIREVKTHGKMRRCAD